MEKSQVIYVRDSIKMGKNYPVKVYVDSTPANFDEGTVGEFVKWDDDNEIITCVRLDSPQTNKYPNNVVKTVNIYSACYADIRAIEASIFPLDDLYDFLTTIGVAEPYSTNVTKMFGQLLRTDITGFTSEDYNNIMGGEMIDNKDEYYSGRFTEPWLETRRYAEWNAEIAAKHKAAKDDSEGDGDDSGDDTNP